MRHTLPIALFSFLLGLALGTWLATPARPPAPATSTRPTPPAVPSPDSRPAAAPPRAEGTRPNTVPLTAQHTPTLTSRLATIRRLLDANRLDAAEEALERLFDDHPWQPDALLLRVDWLARSGDHDAAIDLLLERRSLERDAARAAQVERRLGPLFEQAIAAAGAAPVVRLARLARAVDSLPGELRYVWQTAETEFALRRYADCRQTLQPLLYDTTYGEQARQLDRRAERRRALALDYRHRLPLIRHADHHLLRVGVGGVELTLLLDTGAGITLLQPQAAARAGLRPDGRHVRLTTVGGQVDAPLAEAGITLPGLTEVRQSVVIHASGLPEGIDGLLGMDLLRHFAFHIDRERDLLLLDEATP